MKVDSYGVKLIADFEGLSLVPYLCPAKKPTIGYGQTFYPNGTKVRMTDKAITEKEAFAMLEVVVNQFAIGVEKLLVKKVNQHQFNALVSFAYNCGITNLKKSTLLKKVNANPNDSSIELEFLKWNKSMGKVLAGLTRRRRLEADVYKMPISSSN